VLQEVKRNSDISEAMRDLDGEAHWAAAL